MLFNVALFSSLLLVPAVLALPPRSGAHLARRREGRQSQRNSRLEQHTSAASNTDYSDNWAGAILNMGDGTFTSVTGTFTVPTPSGSTGASAAAWVGIDGSTCQTAILQTGVDFTVENGQPKYDAWYEWYPAASHVFSGIVISARDVIQLTVNASTTTSGTATINNLTNGQAVSKKLSSSSPLCGQNAEWIVEDYMDGPSLVPFADFGTVTFTSAKASGNGAYTPSGATITEIKQNNKVLTSTSLAGSSVTIKYL